MRALLVRFVGLAVYVHELTSGTLTLLHERPNRRPMVYILNEEDFEDGVDELDDESVATLEPGLAASAVGLNLRLIKNDGVLKVTFEGEHGGVVDWSIQGLRSSNGGGITACAFTQTLPEAPQGCKCVKTLPPELSNSTIQTMSTNPIPGHIVRPPQSGLSIISTTIENRPVECSTKLKVLGAKCDFDLPAIDEKIGLKRKAAEEAEQPKPHKRAKSSHDSPPWPNHLYMTCCRTQPISKSDIGTLHIDLIEGSVWFEGWSGKSNARTFEQKQIDLRDASTSVQYFLYDNDVGTDRSTHHLNITRVNTKHELTPLFVACCSAPGWRMWGSDTHTSPGPNRTITSREQARAKQAGIKRKIPSSLPANATTKISPTIIVDAIVHCIDRATRRQPIHDPETDHKLLVDLERFARFQEERCLSTEAMVTWDFTVKEVKERESRRRSYRTVDEEKDEEKKAKSGDAERTWPWE